MPEFIRKEKVLNDRLREVERGVVECDCGREVLCYAFTNECECGRLFNMSGQQLAPRSQWMEDCDDNPYDDDLPGMRDEDYEQYAYERGEEYP